jgi:hypothetical protein
VPGFAVIPEGNDVGVQEARLAHELWRADEKREAIALLEATLESCAAINPELPGWLVLRLATAYRSLRRHDDEVSLLVRSRASQTRDVDRSRHDARLTKAQTLADRHRRTESGAVVSVRNIKRPKSRNPVALSHRASPAAPSEQEHHGPEDQHDDAPPLVDPSDTS